MSNYNTSSYTDRSGVVRCGDCDTKIEDCFCMEAMNAREKYIGSGLGEDAESLGQVGATVETEYA